jgi:hypothetical protein
MPESRENKSEVARILEQISLEYEAAYRSMHAYAAGAAKHQFITARMENMGNLHSKLQEIVGDSAIEMVAETLNKLP